MSYLSSITDNIRLAIFISICSVSVLFYYVFNFYSQSLFLFLNVFIINFFFLFQSTFLLHLKSDPTVIFLNHAVMSKSLQPQGPQHTRLPCPSPSPRACSNSCPLRADAIQPPWPLASPSPPAFSLFQHQGLF